MIQPNEVNSKITELNNLLIAGKIKPNIYWKYIDDSISNETCANCEGKVNTNTYNELDRKEYFISALCNECQVYFFRKEENEKH